MRKEPSYTVIYLVILAIIPLLAFEKTRSLAFTGLAFAFIAAGIVMLPDTMTWLHQIIDGMTQPVIDNACLVSLVTFFLCLFGLVATVLFAFWLGRDEATRPLRTLGMCFMPIAVILMFTLTAYLFKFLEAAQAQRRHRVMAIVRNLNRLDPTEFEEYVGMLFKEADYIVRHTGQAGDRGIDLVVIHPDGTPCVVQCKRYSHPVGPATIRELYGAMMRDDIKTGYLVTTSRFTKGARQEAQDISRNGHKIRLVDGDLLARKIRKLGLPAEIKEV
jgi:HJR/Mrr/RecB family endonuclease